MAGLLERFLKKSTDPSILIGTIHAFITKVISAGGIFFLNIVIARRLGAAEAGYFFLAQAVAVFLASISRQGFDNALIRFIASYRVSNEFKNVANIFGYATLRVVILGSMISILVYLFSPAIGEYVFSKEELTPVLRVAAWLIMPLAISQLVGFCFQGKKRVAIAMSYQSAYLAVVAVIIIAVISPANAFSAMKLYVYCSAGIALLAIIHWVNDLGVKPERISQLEKEAVNKSIRPLFMILLMSQITQWSGQLFLGSLYSSADVALFSTAQRTAMLNSFILVAVNAIAAPKFAEAFRQDNLDEIKKIVILSGRLIAFAAFPLILSMWLFAPWIMSLFGEEFTSAANVLRILALGQFVNVITGSVAHLLQMTGNEKLLRNNMFISCAILVVGSLFLVPLYGIYGAAIATAVSISCENLLCVYQVKKKLGFNTLSFWNKHQ